MTDAPLRVSLIATEPGFDALLGRVIAGKFSVDERLGAGAMGIVYRARQLALDRRVAIKVLHREYAAESGFAERFWGEAKAASRLDHPNSIRVIDFGQEPDGLLYLVMEYVEGCDLFELISERGPLSPSQIVAILSQVLAALAVAHDMAVVHRDLKPENIMIVRGKSDDGRAMDVVKVCDFGIAKILDTAVSDRESRRKHSTTGLVVGTPAYMSPEQARGEKLDARSDLYSVGVVLYELLTGRVPFEGESVISIALKHINEFPVAPSSLAPGVDPDLEAICLRAMSKKPAERFQSAREMRLASQGAANKGLSTQSSAAATLDSVTAQPKRLASSKHTRAWLAALALPLAGLWALVHFRSSSADPRDRGELAPSGLPVSPAVAHIGAAVADERAPSASAGVVSASSALAVSAPSDSHALSRPAPRYSKVERAQPVPAARDTTTPVGAVAAMVEPRRIAEPEVPPQAPPMVPMPAQSAPSPSAAAAASAAQAPAAPAFDLRAAHVVIGSPRNAVGATPASVARAVSEASSRFTACYRAALPQLSGALEGAGVLHIDTDGAGIITDARLSGPIRGNVASCVGAAVQGHRVANVDTGSASADVPLSFRAH